MPERAASLSVTADDEAAARRQQDSGRLSNDETAAVSDKQRRLQTPTPPTIDMPRKLAECRARLVGGLK